MKKEQIWSRYWQSCWRLCQLLKNAAEMVCQLRFVVQNKQIQFLTNTILGKTLPSSSENGGWYWPLIILYAVSSIEVCLRCDIYSYQWWNVNTLRHHLTGKLRSHITITSIQTWNASKKLLQNWLADVLVCYTDNMTDDWAWHNYNMFYVHIIAIRIIPHNDSDS